MPSALARLTALVFLAAAGLIGSHSLRSALSARVLGPDARAARYDQIIVNPRAVVRTIPSSFFGINEVGFWDGVDRSAASARALSQTAIRALRFPGGAPADWYDWQDPYRKGWSSTSPLQSWEYGRRFHATSIVFQTNYAGNLPDPPGKSYAVNSPQNAAAWVAYNRDHGIPATMEVGNEEDMNTLKSADDPHYQPYVDAFNTQARAMHTADPHVRVIGPAGTNEWYWWALDGLGMFLKGAGNRQGTGQADGVSLHFYKGGAWSDSKGVAQYWLSSKGPWAAIQSMIKAHDTRRLPVYLTEWNLGSSDANNAFTPTLGHALATADMLGALALSGVAQEDYFDVHGASGWGILYGSGEHRPADSPTPTYYTMALWRHMGRHMVSLRQSDDAASMTSSYATSGKNGSTQILIINKQARPRVARIELERASPNGHRLSAYLLRGSTGSVGDVSAIYNGRKNPTPQRALPGPVSSVTVHGKSIRYVVPAYSAVVLNLEGSSLAPKLHWKPISAAPPPPALQVSTAGQVAHSTLTGGQSQDLTATVQANDDLGPTLIDLEVYDPSGAKAFQQTEVATLTAGRRVTVRKTYTLPATAYGGTYKFMIGIFGTSWSPTYAWNDKAGTFTVSGPPPPKVSIAGSGQTIQARRLQSVDLTAHITVQNSALRDCIVDFELYTASGAKAWQDAKYNVTLPVGTQTVSDVLNVPADTPAGTYTLKVGVFGATWAPNYAWNDHVADVHLGPSGTSSHVATQPPPASGEPTGFRHTAHAILHAARQTLRALYHTLRSL